MALLALAACSDPAVPGETETRAPGVGGLTTTIPIYTFRVVNAYPHDPGAFTQGLVYDHGGLIEGTGLYGRSSLRKLWLENAYIGRLVPLPDAYFGEGVTVFSGTIYQLTWRSRVGFLYDVETFEKTGEFSYPTEGWGITHDGQRLIVSDGSSTLYFRDPETLAETGRIRVYDDRGPVRRLNELEFVEGEIYANVWQESYIARIDPQTGAVVGWIELAGLYPPADYNGSGQVLNGIAYDPPTGRLFVTGKLWPQVFEIEILPFE